MSQFDNSSSPVTSLFSELLQEEISFFIAATSASAGASVIVGAVVGSPAGLVSAVPVLLTGQRLSMYAQLGGSGA